MVVLSCRYAICSKIAASVCTKLVIHNIQFADMLLLCSLKCICNRRYTVIIWRVLKTLRPVSISKIRGIPLLGLTNYYSREAEVIGAESLKMQTQTEENFQLQNWKFWKFTTQDKTAIKSDEEIYNFPLVLPADTLTLLFF